jgi:hypothetical protein
VPTDFDLHPVLPALPLWLIHDRNHNISDILLDVLEKNLDMEAKSSHSAPEQDQLFRTKGHLESGYT